MGNRNSSVDDSSSPSIYKINDRGELCTCDYLASGCKCSCVQCRENHHCKCEKQCNRTGLTAAELALWKTRPHVSWQGPVLNAMAFDHDGVGIGGADLATDPNAQKYAQYLLPSWRDSAAWPAQPSVSTETCGGRNRVDSAAIYRQMYRTGGMQTFNSRANRGLQGAEFFSAGRKCNCSRDPCVCRKADNGLSTAPSPLELDLWGYR